MNYEFIKAFNLIILNGGGHNAPYGFGSIGAYNAPKVRIYQKKTAAPFIQKYGRGGEK